MTTAEEEPIPCSPDTLYEQEAKRVREYDEHCLAHKDECEERICKDIRTSLMAQLDGIIDPKTDKVCTSSLAISTGKVRPNKYNPYVDRVLAEFNRADGKYEYRISGSSNWGTSKDAAYFVDLCIYGHPGVGEPEPTAVPFPPTSPAQGTSDPKYSPDAVMQRVAFKKEWLEEKRKDEHHAMIQRNLPIVRAQFLQAWKREMGYSSYPVEKEKVNLLCLLEAQERKEKGEIPPVEIQFRVDMDGMKDMFGGVLRECLERYVLPEFNAHGKKYEFYMGEEHHDLVRIRKRLVPSE